MKERKLPIILFSLIFAFLVWMSVNLGNQFQTSIEVPVHIENLKESQAIAVPLPSSVRFKVQGTGWQLLNALITPNLNYTIDFSIPMRGDFLFTSKDLIERVQLSNGLHVFESSPETVLVRLDEKYSKKIPVIPQIKAFYREGFGQVGTLSTDPDSIIITGARSLLNSIHKWKTMPLELHDINAPVSMRVPLSDSLQLELEKSTSAIDLHFDVQPIAEKTINDISIEILHAPDNRSIVLIPPKVSIIIRSGVNNVANISEKDFNAYIDYKSILLDTSGFVQATISGPNNVQIVQQNPDKIQYVVRKQKNP